MRAFSVVSLLLFKKKSHPFFYTKFEGVSKQKINPKKSLPFHRKQSNKVIEFQNKYSAAHQTCFIEPISLSSFQPPCVKWTSECATQALAANIEITKLTHPFSLRHTQKHWHIHWLMNRTRQSVDVNHIYFFLIGINSTRTTFHLPWRKKNCFYFIYYPRAILFIHFC